MNRPIDLHLKGLEQLGASIELKDYNPKVITFGAVRALTKPCSQLDGSRHYRFVAAGDHDYDEWANSFTSLGAHVGEAFLIDSISGQKGPGVYLGLNDDITRSPKDTSVHNRGNYWTALENVFADPPCFPIQFSGWELGHWCNENDECTSQYCVDGVCGEAKKSGDLCVESGDCESGSCTRANFWSRKRCG